MRKGNSEFQNVTANKAAEFDANKLLVGTRAISSSASGNANDLLDRVAVNAVAASAASGAPEAHAASHQNGGADQINVAGLSGLLADAQTPLTHASSHKHGGADEIGTATPAANVIPKADGSGKLDGFISNASTTVKGLVELAADGETTAGTVVQGNDSRLVGGGGGGAPDAHATSHQHGGSDEVATATPAANAIPKADGSGKLDNWVTGAPAATTSVAGLVELATDGEAVANVVVQGNDSRVNGNINFNECFWLRDEKAQGTASQSLPDGVHTVRELQTTVVNTISGASLASNQFTLPAGTYFAMAKARAREDTSGTAPTAIGETILSVYDTVGASYLDHAMKLGTLNFSEPTYDDWVVLNAYFTVASSRALELRHYAYYPSDGGRALNISGFTERYAEIIIFKIG